MSEYKALAKAVLQLCDERDAALSEADRWNGEYQSADRDWKNVAAERDSAKAEVEMLRGVGCSEDGDGPCGACIKCARADVERITRERDESQADARKYYGPAGLKAVSEYIAERDSARLAVLDLAGALEALTISDSVYATARAHDALTSHATLLKSIRGEG